MFAASVLVAAAGLPGLRAAEDPSDIVRERQEVHARFPDAFAPVADTPGLPRVLLIGDSISIGYTAAVRQSLHGVANVHRIPDNGGPTTRGLQLIEEWLNDGAWDVIHFNFGLHDIARVRDGQPRTSSADYEANLLALVTRLRSTRARLIFATTTPVPEGELHPPRHDADAVAYNDIARRVMRDSEVAIDDLYGVARPQLSDVQQPANVHFTPAGYRVLANAVVRSIREHLDP